MNAEAGHPQGRPASTEALARVLAAADGLEDGLSVFPLRMTRYWSSAQTIIADPAPLLAALPDSAIEAEALRRFYPARHMTGLSDQ